MCEPKLDERVVLETQETNAAPVLEAVDMRRSPGDKSECVAVGLAHFAEKAANVLFARV